MTELQTPHGGAAFDGPAEESLQWQRRKSSDARIPELDALRGIAALMVLIAHLPRGLWFGQTGVDLFFVLSGFLISRIILQNRERPGFLKVFYARRVLRIFPIYYLALLGMVLINTLRKHPFPIDGIWYYLTYMQGVPFYWGGTTPPVGIPVGHLWTLAIEEQFYLVWPLALITLNVRRIPLICIGALGLSFSLRATGFDPHVLLSRSDGLVWGGLLAWLELGYGTTKRKSLALIYAICCSVGFVTYSLLWIGRAPGMTGNEMDASNRGILVISIAYFGLIGLVQAHSGSPWLAALRLRPLIALGTISYGVYLYHWPIFEYMDEISTKTLGWGAPLWLDALMILTSLVAAMVSWRFIEEPILRLKDRFSY